MHAEPAVVEHADTGPQTESRAAEERFASKVFGNFMDTLLPAKPPEPKNARIVRQFDLEAAKTDRRPDAQTCSKQPQPQQECRSREEARAMRNRSLRAAAGLE